MRLGHESFGQDLPAQKLNVITFVPILLRIVWRAGNGVRGRPYLALGYGETELWRIGTGRFEAVPSGKVNGLAKSFKGPVGDAPSPGCWTEKLKCSPGSAAGRANA